MSDAHAQTCILSVQAELCCWTGPKLVQDTLLDNMPDSMRKDVEKLLEDIPANARGRNDSPERSKPSKLS